MTLKDRPALLLIDIQQGLEETAYYGGHRNNIDAEIKAAHLLQFWRANDLPIVHIKHNGTPPSPLTKGLPGNNFKKIVHPEMNEKVVEKDVNSAFIGTSLKEFLDKEQILQVILVGLTTDHCVSSTARMAKNLGYDTYVISDATATFDKIGPANKKHAAEEIHEVALASLHQEFATILETKTLLAKLTH
ncbi:MAG: cysteine hydrolase [Muriicola sp.]|nr:cysteine hydrolase [Muriicola sp.]